jgi:hypothetical protein
MTRRLELPAGTRDVYWRNGGGNVTYEYDVFYSYKRDLSFFNWHRKIVEILTAYMRMELPDEPRVFFDADGIKAGEAWEERLGRAVRHSKCLLCIWSPAYFNSTYCVSEWMSFAERERVVDKGLIVPAKSWDGENFPPIAKRIQMKDFSDFTHMNESFWKTEDAVTFESVHLRLCAVELARIVREAPPFDPNFPFREIKPEDIAHGQLMPQKKIGRIAKNKGKD